jgi:hypothetical protein
MTATYEAIKTYTATSDVSSFSWTSIPNTYDDLVIVAYLKNSAGSNYECYARFNNVSTGSLYTYCFVQNYQGNLQAGRNATINEIRQFKTSSARFSAHEMNIMQYKNTNVYKTTVGRSGDVTMVSTILGYGQFRSYSAITDITLVMEPGANIVTGSKFDLYGIKAE